MKVALDADVCIYSVVASPWTVSVRARLAGADLMGSAMLPVELLPKPRRLGNTEEEAALRMLLRRVQLVEVTLDIAALASELATAFSLRALDAVHLATAVRQRADVFYTNNTRDFAAVQITGLPIEHPVRA